MWASVDPSESEGAPFFGPYHLNHPQEKYTFSTEVENSNTNYEHRLDLSLLLAKAFFCQAIALTVFFNYYSTTSRESEAEALTSGYFR